jgi:hypothetical protein
MNPDLIRAQIAGLRATHPELVEDEESWLLALESETDLTETLRAIERKRQETAGLAGGIMYAVTQLHERQERFERRETALRAILFKLMQAADLRKVELPEATLSVRNGTPRVVITDDPLFPDASFGASSESRTRLASRMACRWVKPSPAPRFPTQSRAFR